MKQLFSIVLMMSFSIPFLIKGVIVVYWKWNQQSIIENYCINKNKPKSCCQGKCYLLKELKALDTSTDKNSVSYPLEDIFKQEVTLFYEDTTPLELLNFCIIIITKTLQFGSENYYSNYLSYCFHPPQELFGSSFFN